MKQKLLVFTSTFPRWPGDKMPSFVYELSKRLTNTYEVRVLTPMFPGANEEEVMEGMKIKRFHYGLGGYETLAGNGGMLPALKKSKLNYLKIPFFMIGEFFALKKEIKEHRPDVIHAHWIIPQGLVASLLKKRTGVEYVVTSHGSDLMGIKGFTDTKKKVLRNAKNVTVVSNALKKEAEKICPYVKIEVIPMGVDTDLFTPKKKDSSLKEKHKINGPFLIFVGRLAPEKGIDILIEAMPEVIRKSQRTKLVIIGDGTMKNWLNKRVEELNIKDNVVFVGWVDNKDLPRYYATADVFVGPSRREGFGLTFVEAGLCGCWLIGTRNGGITDIIREGENGFFTSGDSKDLAKKIILSLKKKSFRKLENFDWNTVYKKYSEVLG